jgi:hypothetical protein
MILVVQLTRLQQSIWIFHLDTSPAGFDQVFISEVAERANGGFFHRSHKTRKVVACNGDETFWIIRVFIKSVEKQQRFGNSAAHRFVSDVGHFLCGPGYGFAKQFYQVI